MPDAAKNTEYAGNYVYSDNESVETMKLQFINHPEGYIEPVANTFKSKKRFRFGIDGGGTTTYSSYSYVFQYKDHLGNVRLSYSDADLNGSIDPSSEIIEESNYYPFGLKQKGYNNIITGGNDLAQQWKFGGKQFDESLGLDWYDYGARNYDASLGRWMNIDPMTDTYTSVSPFIYALNSPIYFVDPDGERIDISAIYKKDNEGNDVLDEDGNRIIVGLDISVTGKVINESSTSLSGDELSSIASDISSSIKSSFSSASENGFEVNVSTDISVASADNPLNETDHAFTIVDSGKIPDGKNPGKFRPNTTVGYAMNGELGIYLSTDLINDPDLQTPATTGKYAGTGLTSSGYGTLERTAPHEVGHTANHVGHPTPGTMDGNLMHQSGQPNAGNKLTKAQVLKMYEDFKNGVLNNGRQFYNQKTKTIGPRKANGSF